LDDDTASSCKSTPSKLSLRIFEEINSSDCRLNSEDASSMCETEKGGCNQNRFSSDQELESAHSCLSLLGTPIKNQSNHNMTLDDANNFKVPYMKKRDRKEQEKDLSNNPKMANLTQEVTSKSSANSCNFSEGKRTPQSSCYCSQLDNDSVMSILNFKLSKEIKSALKPKKTPKKHVKISLDNNRVKEFYKRKKITTDFDFNERFDSKNKKGSDTDSSADLSV